MKPYYFIGLDLGQRRDHSALVIAERRMIAGRAWNPVLGGYPGSVRLEVQRVERFAIGTEYVTVVRRVAEIVRKLQARGAVVRIAMDATGVGVAVWELMKAEGLGGITTPVTVIGGGIRDRAGGGESAGQFVSVSKVELFYGLMVGMEQDRTALSAGMPFLQDLLDELRLIGVEFGSGGTKVTGAKGERHDDLAFAAALAQWAGTRSFPGDVARAEKVAQGRLL